MSLRENVRLALIALRANKLRSFLTMLGMIIGVAAVITLISVGQGVEVFVAEQFQGLGNNLLFVFPGQFRPDGPPRQRRAGLTNDDVAALSDPLLGPRSVTRGTGIHRSAVSPAAETKREPALPVQP
jgi:putative ABC transport system permease protein